MRMTAACCLDLFELVELPLAAAGQTWQVSAQASGVRMFESQNGQVRHCRGRAA